MTLHACVLVVQEAVGGTSSGADSMQKVTRLGQKSFLRFEASETIRRQRSHARSTGRVAIVAGVVLGVQALPTGFHTLALVEEEPARTQGTLGYRRSPTGGAGAVATSASVVAVGVMASRTLGNTFPMMQGGPRWAAHALGVVRETGGAGRITGVTDAFLTVESGPAVRDTLAVLEQGSGI